jgi:hypothetical protein
MLWGPRLGNDVLMRCVAYIVTGTKRKNEERLSKYLIINTQNESEM